MCCEFAASKFHIIWMSWFRLTESLCFWFFQTPDELSDSGALAGVWEDDLTTAVGTVSATATSPLQKPPVARLF